MVMVWYDLHYTTKTASRELIMSNHSKIGRYTNIFQKKEVVYIKTILFLDLKYLIIIIGINTKVRLFLRHKSIHSEKK